ncbi:GNAT family N-acetyltransferase [Bradyrhizobium neotropicale]|uniref:GNAT family N-acetyltransferase n=1 Tax=Bradyrhizobium neotropicale TaxID=1497615 RepID=UPI001AD78F5C|nr:GNAT family N-acetyltransferase [Bradyrhizobium neotropicale]MBO4220851.1 GNAT family N-acetyltransferase [Bradyrhizobium neotropicale]
MRAHQSPRLRLHPIKPHDESRVDDLLDRLNTYSLRVHGVPKLKDGAHRLLTTTPPVGMFGGKYVFAIMHGIEPVGLLDVIADYPKLGTTFIGLLAIAEDRQGAGLGRAAFWLAEDFARTQLSSSHLRLAVVNTNSVGGFWRRMGFVETGEVCAYEGLAARKSDHDGKANSAGVEYHF